MLSTRSSLVPASPVNRPGLGLHEDDRPPSASHFRSKSFRSMPMRICDCCSAHRVLGEAQCGLDEPLSGCGEGRHHHNKAGAVRVDRVVRPGVVRPVRPCVAVRRPQHHWHRRRAAGQSCTAASKLARPAPTWPRALRSRSASILVSATARRPVAAIPMDAAWRSPGRHCHSTLSSTIIDCHSLGMHMIILLPLLSFSVKMIALPRAILARLVVAPLA